MHRPIELSGSTLPSRLRELKRPPARLYVVGSLPRGASVAIVGTRTCSAEARLFTRRLARQLAERGIVILSGGAHGHDTEAHQGALDVGGTTVVVAPSSFDRPYPEENAALFSTIVEQGGAFVSAFAHKVAPRRGQFFARNSYLAALAHVVVVVETRARGGARNTAKWARRLGRSLFVVPHAPWNACGGGCLAELQLGAAMLRRAEDVLAELARQRAHAWPARRAAFAQAELPGLEIPAPVESVRGRALAKRPNSRSRRAGPGENKSIDPVDCELRGDLAQVLDVFADQPLHPDIICGKTGLRLAVVRSSLLTLTLKGILVSHRSGYFSLVTARN